MKHVCDENGCRLIPDTVVKSIKSKFLKNIFDQNTYVCLGEKEAVVIDAGAEVEDVVKAANGKKIVAVLMTHLHFDHIWNLEKFVKSFDCPVYIKHGEEERLTDAEKNVSYMIKKEIKINIPKSKIKYFEPQLNIGEFEFEIFETPGHSADSVCIKLEENLFTGDTVFFDNIGRFDFADGSVFDMKKSLEKILKLEYKTAYPGHFEKTTKNEIDSTIHQFLKNRF